MQQKSGAVSESTGFGKLFRGKPKFCPRTVELPDYRRCENARFMMEPGGRGRGPGCLRAHWSAGQGPMALEGPEFVFDA